MKVFVTGLEGFTGNYVRQRLQDRNHEVIGMNADLLDSASIVSELADANPDAIIHLAAVAFAAAEDIDSMYQINSLGTRTLLAAIRTADISPNRVILASSAAVYGRADGLLSEKAPIAPVNDYGISKYTMEMISRLWSTSIPTTIVRPFNYTGNGQGKQFVIPKIVHHFAQRKASIELGNLDVAREFNDVRFVADVYTKLLEIDSASIEATLNICTGRTYTLLEVIRELSDITGNSINIVVDERFVRSNDPKVLGGDPQTLRSVIPDQEQFRLRDTLQWMLNSST